jgi:hypothetical protein
VAAFAEKIVRADAQAGRLILVFDILRRVADDAVRVEALSGPDGGVPGQINVRPDPAARASDTWPSMTENGPTSTEESNWAPGLMMAVGWIMFRPCAGAARIKWREPRRVDRVQTQAQARFAPIGPGAMDDP